MNAARASTPARGKAALLLGKLAISVLQLSGAILAPLGSRRRFSPVAADIWAGSRRSMVLGPKRGGLLSGKIARIVYCDVRRGGRAVECTGLENRRTLASTVGSNPTLSAK